MDRPIADDGPADPEALQERWAGLSGEYSPDYYAYYGPNDTSELLRETVDDAVGRDPAVLELGCSAGRHLAHLHDAGYRDLAGIDVNEDAIAVLTQAYPDLAADGTFYNDAIEAVVPEFADDEFDVVYAVETLQHVHPDSAWVFAELARVTGSLLVTVENEGSAEDRRPDGPAVNYVDDGVPLFYRDWNRVFTDCGLTEVDSRALDRDTFRAFRPADA